jgi:tellurite resistance protein TerC
MEKSFLAWSVFYIIIILLLFFDLGVLHKKNKKIDFKESLILSGFYICIGLIFGLFIWKFMGLQSMQEYYTGFIIEKTLAIDNIFVILMIFNFMKINSEYQHKVLFWGIIGAIVTRLILISSGVMIFQKFEILMFFVYGFLICTGALMINRKLFYISILVVFAILNAIFGFFNESMDTAAFLVMYGFLIIIAIIIIIPVDIFYIIKKIARNQNQKVNLKIKQDKNKDNKILKFIKKIIPHTNEIKNNKFFIKEIDSKTGKFKILATPLFIALICIEIIDIIFALDSIPAIMSITLDKYIIYTSNIFAVLGLRALYFALSGLYERFHYLKYALGVLLIFIGLKTFIALIFLESNKFPTHISLFITLIILSSGILFSFYKTRKIQNLN